MLGTRGARLTCPRRGRGAVCKEPCFSSLSVSVGRGRAAGALAMQPRTRGQMAPSLDSFFSREPARPAAQPRDEPRRLLQGDPAAPLSSPTAGLSALDVTGRSSPSDFALSLASALLSPETIRNIYKVLNPLNAQSNAGESQHNTKSEGNRLQQGEDGGRRGCLEDGATETAQQSQHCAEFQKTCTESIQSLELAVENLSTRVFSLERMLEESHKREVSLRKEIASLHTLVKRRVDAEARNSEAMNIITPSDSTDNTISEYSKELAPHSTGISSNDHLKNMVTPKGKVEKDDVEVEIQSAATNKEVVELAEELGVIRRPHLEGSLVTKDDANIENKESDLQQNKAENIQMEEIPEEKQVYSEDSDKEETRKSGVGNNSSYKTTEDVLSDKKNDQSIDGSVEKTEEQTNSDGDRMANSQDVVETNIVKQDSYEPTHVSPTLDGVDNKIVEKDTKEIIGGECGGDISHPSSESSTISSPRDPFSSFST